MDIISKTAVPFTVSEEIVYSQKFTRTYQSYSQGGIASREAACLAV